MEKIRNQWQNQTISGLEKVYTTKKERRTEHHQLKNTEHGLASQTLGQIFQQNRHSMGAPDLEHILLQWQTFTSLKGKRLLLVEKCPETH